MSFHFVLNHSGQISRPQGYRTFFLLNATKHEIYPAHKNVFWVLKRTVLLSAHNICFGWGTKKKVFSYAIIWEPGAIKISWYKVIWLVMACIGSLLLKCQHKIYMYIGKLICIYLGFLQNEQASSQAKPTQLSWVKVFSVIPEFRILRLTFCGKLASKCWIREIIIANLIYFQSA